MRFLVIFCIFGAVFNRQVEMCRPFRGVEDTIDRATRSIKDLRKYINGLKENYEMSLIDIKISKTEKIYAIMYSTLDLVRTEMIRVTDKFRDKNGNILACYESSRGNLTRLSIAVSKAMQKCVENNMDVTKPLEKEIKKFLDDRKLCLLNLDLVRVQACIENKDKMWTECIDEHTHTVPLNGIANPSSCDYDKYTFIQTKLEKKFSSHVQLGLLYTLDCISPLERKYESDLQRMTTVRLQCIKDYI